MAPSQKPLTFTGDENFRKGACHGTQWFLETTRTLIAEGRSPGEIVEHLNDLSTVIVAWRGGAGELPDGNPWDWSFKDLASVIKARKEE
ncbi:MAG: hypothetical protein WDN28_13050 [Chthoniobacter sp.]